MIEKLLSNNVNKLLLMKIVSNVRTVMYEIAKYLANLLSALGNSIYTINSRKQFVIYVKKQKEPDGCKIVSFDVASVFTNMLLDRTTNIILRRIYIDKKLIPLSLNLKWKNNCNKVKKIYFLVLTVKFIYKLWYRHRLLSPI